MNDSRTNNTVTIAVCTYNAEVFIDHCLKTILDQDVDPRRMKILLVDDGSTDGTVNKLQVCKQKSRFECQVIANDTNRGLTSVRYEAIEAADTDFIGFIDSDDWVDVSYCRKMLGVADRSGADIIACDFTRSWMKSGANRYLSSGSKDAMEAFSEIMKGRGHFPLWPKFIRKGILKEINKYFDPKTDARFDVSKKTDDMTYSPLTYAFAQNVAYVDEILHYVGNQPNHITAVWDKSKKNRVLASVQSMNSIDFMVDVMKKRGIWNKYKRTCTPYIVNQMVAFLDRCIENDMTATETDKLMMQAHEKHILDYVFLYGDLYEKGAVMKRLLKLASNRHGKNRLNII